MNLSEGSTITIIEIDVLRKVIFLLLTPSVRYEKLDNILLIKQDRLIEIGSSLRLESEIDDLRLGKSAIRPFVIGRKN